MCAVCLIIPTNPHGRNSVEQRAKRKRPCCSVCITWRGEFVKCCLKSSLKSLKKTPPMDFLVARLLYGKFLFLRIEPPKLFSIQLTYFGFSILSGGANRKKALEGV